MSIENDLLSDLSAADSNVPNSVLERFEDAWHRGDRPPLEEFLASAGDASSTALLPLVHIDLEFRIKAGEAVRVEAYLERFPALASQNDVVRALIESEFRFRRRRETSLTEEEYARRFPELYADRPTGVYQHEPGSAQDPTATAPTQRTNAVPVKPEQVQDPNLPRIPGFIISGTLGRGGMGVVYKARQEKLNRLVALKMILAGKHADAEDLDRFLAEARAVARLQHPNIVQIHEIGEWEGKPYFSLEFVDGGSLDKRLAHTPQPVRAAAELSETLARAMHAAHQQGIVHRDLKPANVLLAISDQQSAVRQKEQTSGLSADSCLLNATPKITDFGLAKQLDDDSGQTRSGAIMGTPSYMAPEQALGQTSTVGPAADVYALGVILYEMLTGRPPFKGATVMDTLQQVRTQEPVPPARLQPKVPRDLDTICLKCLRKEPNERYASALVLADDLRRFLAGEPVLARPVGRWERTVKWARRRPTAAALLAVSCLAVLIVGTAIPAFYHQRASHLTKEKDRFDRAEKDVETALLEGERVLAANDYKGAVAAGHEALAAIALEPSLENHRARAESIVERGAAGLKARESARATLKQFARWRDDALFYATQFTGLDVQANLAKVQESAQAALELFLADDPGPMDGAPATARLRRRLKPATTSDGDPGPMDGAPATARLRRRLKPATTSADDPGPMNGAPATARLRRRLKPATTSAGDPGPMDGAPAPSAPLPVFTAAYAVLSPEEQADIKADCYELLLVLAEAVAHPVPGRSLDEQHGRAEQAIDLLHRAAGLDISTRAYHLQRAGCLDLLDAKEEAREERARAEALANELAAQPTPRQERDLPDALKRVRALDYFLQGYDRYQHDDLAAALADFERAARLRPNRFWPQYFLAIGYLRTNQPSQAESNLNVCLKDRPQFAWSYLYRGYIRGTRGELAWKAGEKAQQADRPEKAKAQFQDAASQFQAADADFQRALELAADDLARFGVYIYRGGLRIQQQKLDEAVADLRNAARLRPNDYHVRENLALAYFKQKKWDEAGAEYDRALELEPGLPELYRSRAQLQLARRRPEAALADLDQAIALERAADKSAANDHLARGQIFFAAGKYPEAVAAYAEAVAGRHDLALAHLERGEALVLWAENELDPKKKRTRYEEAERSLDLYFQYRQEGEKPSARRYLLRAGVREKLAKHLDAVDDYTQALKIKPDAVVHAARGRLYLLLDQPQRALPDFEAALKLDPDPADYYNGRGYARVKLGNHRDGVADAEEALRRGPRTFHLLYHAARIYAQALAKVDLDPSRHDPQLRSRYQDLALRWLRQAVDALPAEQRPAFWRATVKTDAAFDTLKRGPEFKKLAGEYDK